MGDPVRYPLGLCCTIMLHSDYLKDNSNNTGWLDTRAKPLPGYPLAVRRGSARLGGRRLERKTDTWITPPQGIRKNSPPPSGCSLVTIGRLLPPVLGSAALTIASAMWVARTREVLFPALTFLAFLSLPAATHRPERETESRRNKPETSPLLFSSLPSDERPTGEAAISSRWMAVLQKYGTNYAPDSVCHKESHPSDKLGAPGCHKKWPEHSSTNWPR